MITFNDKEMPWYDGMTISQLLLQVDFGNKYVVIKLNGKLVSKPNFETTKIADNSKIFPLPMIAGG